MLRPEPLGEELARLNALIEAREDREDAREREDEEKEKAPSTERRGLIDD